ncbi:MAG: N-acetyltransferase, partial [Lacipirellulaceae bacterium]
MPHLEVIPVESRSDRKRFFNLPWDLYADDENWIPPIRLVQKELLNFKKHPFYDTAEVRHFLALKDGKPAGRVAAIVNHAHNDRYEEKRGFFGFFECVDDQEVAGGLFDAARAWFAE